MTPLETRTVDTQAGPYIIELYYDDDGSADNPLAEYDHEGMAVYLYNREYGRWNVAYDDVAGAGKAGDALAEIIYSHGGYGDNDAVIRRFKKWQAITGDTTVFVDGYLNHPSSAMYFVLVDPASGYTEAEKAAEAMMEEWRAWADGEVYGYVVKDPTDNEVDSCWGFVGMDATDDGSWMMERAVDVAMSDAENRVASANLVGAGFVGLI